MFCRLVFGLLLLGGFAAAGERPNFVLMMADDMGWGQTGYRGHPLLKTPHLDGMAANGLRFERFYAGNPVCSPTRATLLTGRSNDRSGVLSHGYALRLQEKTLARALKDAGYATAHFGKWHLNGFKGPGAPVLADDPRNPGAFGFDTWLSATNFIDMDPLLGSSAGEVRAFEGDSSDVIVAEALRHIETCAADKRPFLVVVWYGTPHSPFKALEPDSLPFSDLDRESREHYGELVALDRSIGAMRAGLRRLGIERDTMLVFNSDNGGLSGIEPPTTGGLRGHKGTVYEGGLRVPGIIEWPGRVKPRVTSHPASTLDLFPTIAELLALPEDCFMKPVDGASLVPLLAEETGPRVKPIPFRFGTKAALIEGDLKIVTEDVRKGPYELYDLAADPEERRDLAAERPEDFKRLRQSLLAWNASVDASFAGADFPGGVLPEPDKVPEFWYEAPIYQDWLPKWRDYWAFRLHFDRANAKAKAKNPAKRVK
jgi:arylsulfatase A-like enzyme